MGTQSRPHTSSRRTTPTAGPAGALGWGVVNAIVARLGTMGIGIVLARVLGPEAFGTYAVAQVALVAVLSFNELGVSLAIVRWPGDPARIAPTVSTISTAASLLFCAGGLVGAPAFTEAMGDPQATSVVRLMLVSVAINGVVATPAALLQRDFRERTRMLIDQVNTWLGAIVSVLLALAGLGAMALAIGRVSGSLVSAVLFIRASPQRFRFGWDAGTVRPLLRFGMPLAGTSIIVFGVGYADQVVAGTQLGTTALGFYLLAFNLSSWPMALLSQPLRRVGPAAFARVQHDAAAAERLLSAVVGALATVAMPVFVGLAAAAVPLVSFVYGREWRPAAAALTWLMIAALARVFAEVCYDFLVVRRRTSSVLAVQALTVVALIPALIVGARLGGIAGIAAAQAAVMALVVLPLYAAWLKRLGIRIGAVLRPCVVPLTAALLVAASAYALVGLVPTVFGALSAAGVVSLAGATAAVYLRRRALNELRDMTKELSFEGEL